MLIFYRLGDAKNFILLSSATQSSNQLENSIGQGTKHLLYDEENFFEKHDF